MRINIKVFFLLGVISLSSTNCWAYISYNEVLNLAPWPETFNQLTQQEKINWLKQQNPSELTEAEYYRQQTTLAFILYQQNHINETSLICAQTPPLREDYAYREICTEASYPSFKAYYPKVLEIIHDARQAEDLRSTAMMLNNLAWRQSQHGDIAGAYSSYETALSIAPTEDKALLSGIMMDTATNYIVHGDELYKRKGIELLEKIRKRALKALETETEADEVARYQNDIDLTNFNTGIAYILHLYEYDKALYFFEKLISPDNQYHVSALSFAALAAAKTGNFDKAKRLLEKVSNKTEGYPVIDQYLGCYRQLAKRHWDKTEKLSNCLNLYPETTIEVELDVYKRLTQIDDSNIQLEGLKKFKSLFINKLESQLKNRGTNAASNTELKRLQRESELKSVVLKQQEELQKERDATHANRQKLFVALFVILVSFILLVASQLRQKKKLAQQYQRMSVRDSLTKLGNRRFLEQQIERELSYVHRARRTEKNAALGIYIFDIDHFKKINDSYGHQAGDEVLLELSRRVSQATRDTDLLVRWGGEEFVYIARLDNNERTYQLADRILKTINQEKFNISNYEPIQVTCTLGVVKYPFIDTGNISLWTRLISLADSALYYGKTKSRNCWVVINNENVVEKEQLEELLNEPLDVAIKKKTVTVKTSFD
ncbi:GGDEF domain-containing protein [Aliikangiella sp. IMCC44653]